MRKLFTVIVMMLAATAGITARNQGPVLTIEGGQVQGVSTDIKGVTVYRGIPFAAPPTGQNRWRPWTKGDWDLSEKMLTAWSNFAKYADPAGPNGGEWKPLTDDNRQSMIFKLDGNDRESSTLCNPLAKQ